MGSVSTRKKLATATSPGPLSGVFVLLQSDRGDIHVGQTFTGARLPRMARLGQSVDAYFKVVTEERW